MLSRCTIQSRFQLNQHLLRSIASQKTKVYKFHQGNPLAPAVKRIRWNHQATEHLLPPLTETETSATSQSVPPAHHKPSCASSSPPQNQSLLPNSARKFGDEPPKVEIHNWYLRNYPGFSFDQDTYQSSKFTDEESRNWYSATFTCPVTQQAYDSGKLCNLRSTTVLEKDGKCYYSKLKVAVHAAAARAIDHITYREQGIKEPRLCEEDPAAMVVDEDFINMLMLTHDSSGAGMSSMKDDGLESSKSSAAETTTAVAAPSIASSISPSIRFYDGNEEEDEDDEEYTIQNLSETTSLQSQSEKSTLERVLEAWAEQKVSLISHQKLMLPMELTLTEQKQQKVHDAIAWCNQMKPAEEEQLSKREAKRLQMSSDSRKFQYIVVPISLAAANMTLRTLADANGLPSDNVAVNKGVEHAANKILDFLQTSSEIEPNVDTYNAYMLCLVRPTLTETAEAAQAMLQSMREGRSVEGKTVPKANVGSFNSVMKLWAQVGGKLGYQKCEEIMQSLLDEADQQGSELRPSRETFLILLASMANPGDNTISQFDKDLALEWIDRMRTYAVSDNDDSMLPDTQVYNAPLRWSGGMMATSSRPYARMLPWDVHEEIFRGGFRTVDEEDDALTNEARKFEEWYRYMENEAGVSPDIETYEAIIQAWVRTGTKEGLANAEDWSLRAIESQHPNTSPRLQTFHPIIASWTYSGTSRGPKKVKYRIERLEEMSADNASLTPDSRLKLVLNTARRSYQQRLVGAGAEPSARNVAKLKESAEACSRLLDDFCSETARSKEKGEIPNSFLDARSFAEVILAWGEVGKFASDAEKKDTAFADTKWEAVSTMIQTVKKLEETIQAAREEYEERNAIAPTVDDTEFAESDRQLRHLIVHSHSVYLDFVSQLNRIDESQSLDAERSSSSVFPRFLPDVEMLLRKSEEYRRLLSPTFQENDKTGAPTTKPLEDSSLMYPDLYSYHVKERTENTAFCETHLALYSAVVNGCARCISASTQVGDCVRLCMLVLNYLKANNLFPATETAANGTDLVAGLIDAISSVSNEHDRTALLRSCADVLSQAPNANVSLYSDALLKRLKAYGTEGVAERPRQVHRRPSSVKRATKSRRKTKPQRVKSTSV